MQRAVMLENYLAQRAVWSFDWRACNCCHFAGEWVRQCLGVDVMAGLPETSSRHSARRVIAQLGGSLRDAWTKQLGIDPISSALASVGDVVCVGDDAVGICAGRTAVVLTPTDGIAYVPMDAATAAWRVL